MFHLYTYFVWGNSTSLHTLKKDQYQSTHTKERQELCSSIDLSLFHALAKTKALPKLYAGLPSSMQNKTVHHILYKLFIESKLRDITILPSCYCIFTEAVTANK